MLKIENDHAFHGPEGPLKLGKLFDGRRQPMVYHFMFNPTWKPGRPAWTTYVDAVGDQSMLARRDTAFVPISRAPWVELAVY